VRRYVTPQLLAIHFVGLLIFGSCLLLSNWQWQRAHIPRKAINPSQVVEYSKLSKQKDYLPPSSVGQRTKATGVWESQNQILLTQRPRDGRLLVDSAAINRARLGSWVVDFLDLGDGSSVAVVRGWLSAGESVTNSTGKQTVYGVVQPAEDAPYEQPISVKELLTTKKLLMNTASNVRDGFIVQTDVQPPLLPVTPTRGAFTSHGLRILNVFYTFNWLFFAFLVLAIWRRVILDEVSSATVIAQSSKLDT